MKILQVSSTDLVGKRFNGQYLTENFGRLGHQSKHLVWEKEGENENTEEMLTFPLSRPLQKVTEKVESLLSVRALLHPSSFFLSNNHLFKQADVVHYHLMYWPNYFSLMAFPKLTHKKPSVWTVHDFWPVTGHCVYPFDCQKWKTGCGECPYLKTNFSMRTDRTHSMWKLKKSIYKKSQFDIVVASQFMKDRIGKSPLMEHFRVHHVPFGLDLNVFKPRNQSLSKKLLGIADDEIVISLRAAPGDYKGFDHIKAALHGLNTNGKKVCLLTVNIKHQLDEFREKFKIVDLGWVNDDELTLNIYDATDFFLMPSTQEAFGMMAMEAMAFSKPVVVFSDTALPEVVGGNENGGIVVPIGDINGLRQAIEKMVTDDAFRFERGQRAIEFARKNYTLDLHMNRLLKVYETAQSNFKK